MTIHRAFALLRSYQSACSASRQLVIRQPGDIDGVEIPERASEACREMHEISDGFIAALLAAYC